MLYLAVDIGSTYTKVTAVDTGNAPSEPPASAAPAASAPRILGTAQAFTTIASDVRQGFHTAVENLHKKIGPFAWDELLCCSSAAGGLTMIALGLVPELTAKAARMAAENAGAKVMRTFAFEISPHEEEEIVRINPDIVLLCGGTDGGNSKVIVHNAQRLVALPGHFAIIVAGNKSAGAELTAVLKDSGKRYAITHNVMPAFGELRIEPAQSRIREIFIERIIEAKGLSALQALSPHPIIPTPLAVLQGCELLSKGTARSPGVGDFMAVDLGGATTDVYSLSKGEPSLNNVLLKGMPEPFAKRTVEGDLGMRYSLPFLLEDAGTELVALTAGVDEKAVTAWAAACAASPDITPANAEESHIDEALAACAVARALTRHCGILGKTYTPLGEMFTQQGKDLLPVPLLVGIGGALRHGAAPLQTLQKALDLARRLAPERMVPRAPRVAVDENYILSAMGLLGTVEPEAALTIMKQELYQRDAYGTAQ